MSFTDDMQKALDYMEAHLTERLDYAEIAKQAACSNYHFQRVFGILCGFTLGEYIRNRRLTKAGAELALGDKKVIDIALKYGYESPDSFTRAFTKFHGITPSEAKLPGAVLTSFAPLAVKISLEGTNMINYKIEEKPEIILTGYKRHFTGAPYGRERAKQEEAFFLSTRAGQWILGGASGSNEQFCAITNVDDTGYDFYIAAALDRYERENLYNTAVTGFDQMEAFGFENIVIPKATYAVFTTMQSRHPVSEYLDIREQISDSAFLTEWEFADAPEIVVYHWAPRPNRESRYVEIWMPIKQIER